MLEQAPDTSPISQDRLIAGHLSLAYGMANRYRRRGLPLEDLRQEALLGLLQAARRYRPEQGARFSTYAVYWIKKQILAALEREKGQSLQAESLEENRVPEPAAPGVPPQLDPPLILLQEIPVRERLVLMLSCQEGLTLKEIAGQLGITVEQVKQIRSKALRRLRGKLRI